MSNNNINILLGNGKHDCGNTFYELGLNVCLLLIALENLI